MISKARQRYLAAGLCGNCGRKRIKGRKYCRKHVEYYRAYTNTAKWKALRRAYDKALHQTPKWQRWNKARRKTAKYLATQRLWQRSPKMRAYFRAFGHKRRCRIAGNGGSWTPAEFESLCREYGHRCACCGKRRKLSPDHIIPVAGGGRNAIDNIQPLCIPCNSSKHAKTGRYTCQCGRHNPCGSERMIPSWTPKKRTASA
jgi:hypothetical protein